jgi:hypothetical protein
MSMQFYKNGSFSLLLYALIFHAKKRGPCSQVITIGAWANMAGRFEYTVIA